MLTFDIFCTDQIIHILLFPFSCRVTQNGGITGDNTVSNIFTTAHFFFLFFVVVKDESNVIWTIYEKAEQGQSYDVTIRRKDKENGKNRKSKGKKNLPRWKGRSIEGCETRPQARERQRPGKSCNTSCTVPGGNLRLLSAIQPVLNWQS